MTNNYDKFNIFHKTTGQFLRLDDKAFHTVGQAWEKAQLPKVFCVTLQITRNVL